MNELEKMYNEVQEMYHDYIEEDGLTPLQSIHYMIEVFALYITKSNKQKALFYQVLMQVIENENIDKEQCSNIIHSYEKAIKVVQP